MKNHHIPLILVVDDETPFVEAFSVKLKAAGFRIESAQSGEEAIKKARLLQPDIILMDVRMPQMNGIEAFLRLKNDAATSQIKVLFLTSIGDPAPQGETANRHFSQSIGAAGYLKKTDDLNNLVEKIEHVLKIET